MALEAPVAASEPDGPTWLGHPRGLFVLFFAELWERFCYYGMRALLVLYLVQQFGKSQEEAGIRYGVYTALVYALGTFGGWIADRVLGYRRAIIVGGVIMALGEFLLVIPKEHFFDLGLAGLIVGNGLFKPNISSLVGKLYKQGDPRRDGGFTIFYMGINIGALLSPIVCQQISQAMGTPGHPDYRYGFLAAGVCMLLGLVCFALGKGTLQGQGVAPASKTGPMPILQVVIGAVLAIPVIAWLVGAGDLAGKILYTLGGLILVYLSAVALKTERVVRQRMFVLLLMLICNVVFWMAFEQAGNSLNFFAQNHTRALELPIQVHDAAGMAHNWTMPFVWFQSVNSVFVVALAPLFAALWVLLDRVKKNPSIPAKFGLGLTFVGLGFMLLIAGIKQVGTDGMVPWYFLAGLYLIQTMGELCLSPVGLSMVTKLAPERITGMVMGAWFITIAIGNDLAGKVSADVGKFLVGVDAPADKARVYATVFQQPMWTAIGVGVALFLLSPFINKWMHGVK